MSMKRCITGIELRLCSINLRQWETAKVRKRHIHVPFLSASHALIKGMPEALKAIYLVVGLTALSLPH
jgi:hypothetical protein